MKKGQIVEGTVIRVDFPAKGIVETQDGVCIVKNVLPGQKVKCSVNKVRNGRAEGRMLEVLEKSPLETEQACPHFGICGGCTYLSLPYEEQLQIKEAQVKKLLDNVLVKGQGSYLFEGIKPSPLCFGYRNKMEFSFGDKIKDGPLTLGMHKRGSFYDVVSVTDCRIVDEDYRRILSCVLSYFDKLQKQGVSITFYHRLRHVGYLRHLLVRKGAATGEILVALITTTQFPADPEWTKQHLYDSHLIASPLHGENFITEDEILAGLQKELFALSLDGTIVGFLHTKNDATADVVQSDETRVLYGRDYFYEEILGLRFLVSQFSFFQTNTLGAQVLYETAREYIEEYIRKADRTISTETDQNVSGKNAIGDKTDKVVYDLYSGTGTIAQLMAPVAGKVIGVEIVGEAVEAAKNNAALNGLHNCEFIAGDVLKVLDNIEQKPDVIILDPPRDGVHPKVLRKILDYGVEHILYISCKPTSLARDLEAFLEKGYVVEKAVAVDQFPWTANVETVCLLSKLNVEHHIEVELNLDEMDLTAAESKATYEEIKAYVKEQTGLQVSNLYIAQVKRKFGIIERVNYNLPKSEDSKQPKCPPEKEEAIKAALEYFKMI